jgi:hypothetical protein
MADIATINISIAYTGPGGESVSAPIQTIACPYQASIAASVDIPVGTLGAAEITVPLGSIESAVTGLMVVNNSGQELEIEFNGGSENPFSLPDGAGFVYAADAAAAESPITALTVTTSTEQLAAGSVYVWAFGDPEVV